MNAVYLNTYFYNNKFLTAVAAGEEYVVVEETTETIMGQPTDRDLRMPHPAGFRTVGGIKRVLIAPADRVADCEQPYLQLRSMVGDCAADGEVYYEQWDEKCVIVECRGNEKALNNSMSYYDARDLPPAVFDSKECKFNVANLNRWMEAAKYCRDNHTKGWSDEVMMRRAAAEGIDLDFVMAQ